MGRNDNNHFLGVAMMSKVKYRLLIGFGIVISLSAVHCNVASKQGGGVGAIEEMVDNFESKLSGWKVLKSPSVDLDYTRSSSHARGEGKSLEIDYSFRTNQEGFIAFVVKDLGHVQDWSQYEGISVWSYIPAKAEDLGHLSVMVYEQDGTAFISQYARSLQSAGEQESLSLFSTFVYSSGPAGRDMNSELDRGRIRKVAVGIYQPVVFGDRRFTIYIDDIELRQGETRPAEAGSDSTVPEEAVGQGETLVLDDFSKTLTGWTKNASPGLSMDYAIDQQITREGRDSLKLKYSFKSKQPFMGYLEKKLRGKQNWQGYDSISMWSYIPRKAKDLVELSIMLYEGDGSAYIAQHARGLKTEGWEELTLSFDKFFLAGDWTTDENDRLDLDQIGKVSIGIFQPSSFGDKNFTIYVNNISVVRAQAGKEAAEPVTTEVVKRQNKLQKYEPGDGKVYHGLFAFSAPLKGWGQKRSDWEDQIDTKEIEAYERASGSKAAVLSFVWFLDWEFPTAMCQRIDKLGKTPHVGITTGQMKPSYIIAGKADEKIAAWARAAKQYGKPVFFRFLAEMNGNWNSYSEAFDPTETHDKYVKAWRQVVDIFRQAGADNIIWVWAPTAVDVGNVHWTDYYPGDNYVDWVGISVYSFLGNGDPEPQILGVYNDYAARKPILIAECGAGDADSNPRKYRPGKSYANNPEKWIHRFFDTLETKAPRVKGFVWFNIDRERVWKIQESPGKVDVFKGRLSNNRYSAKVE